MFDDSSYTTGTDKNTDWKPYHNDMADAIGWLYGGWGRRMELANSALNS